MAITRSEQKEKTRRAIIDAAIAQLGVEKSFASLSLREVAREAGIAPTSFYRHFKDMEELGLTLVDECVSRYANSCVKHVNGLKRVVVS